MKRSTATRNRKPLDSVGSFALGALAGGLAAAATSLFQAAWQGAKLPPSEREPLEIPPTEKVADELIEAATGRPLLHHEREVAGVLVHHTVGAGLGALYALAGERWPAVKARRGLVYGLAVWVIVEECGLAALGLKAPPWRVRPAEHVFAACSHIVFGPALDIALRTLQRASGARTGR